MGNCSFQGDHAMNGYRHLHICATCIYKRCTFEKHPEFSCSVKQQADRRKQERPGFGYYPDQNQHRGTIDPLYRERFAAITFRLCFVCILCTGSSSNQLCSTHQQHCAGAARTVDSGQTTLHTPYKTRSPPPVRPIPRQQHSSHTAEKFPTHRPRKKNQDS